MHDSGGYTSSSDTSSHHSSTSSHTSDTSWNSSHTPHMSSGYMNTGSDGISPAQFFPTQNQAQFSGNSGFRSSGGGSAGLIVVLAVSILLPIVIALIAFLSVG